MAAFGAWTVLAPRPAATLSAAAELRSEWIAVDFHSHTRWSWDGRKRFTPEANLDWHRAMGFDAAYLTDHNRIEGSREASARSARSWREDGVRALRGEELSLDGAHVVALGAAERIDPERYGGPEGLLRFLKESRSRGVLALMSLPEYWAHHRGELDALAAAGAAGFEIVNSTPKGLDLPPSARREVVELCGRRGLFLAAATDNHGWARSACGWDLVRLPGHAELPPARLEDALRRRLGQGGFDAVRVLERPIPRPDSALEFAIDPFRWLWAMLRTLGGAQAAVCALYVLAFLAARLSTRAR